MANPADGETVQIGLNTVLAFLNIIVVLGGGGTVLWLGGRIVQKLESTMNAQAEKIKDLQDERSADARDLREKVDRVDAKIEGVKQTLTAVAVQQERLNRLESDVREMKHGRGFVREAPVG